MLAQDAKILGFTIGVITTCSLVLNTVPRDAKGQPYRLRLTHSFVLTNPVIT